MKEPLAWYCECGSTIKFSGIGDQGRRDSAYIHQIMRRHVAMGHLTVTPDEARLIRQRYREHEALSC